MLLDTVAIRPAFQVGRTHGQEPRTRGHSRRSRSVRFCVRQQPLRVMDLEFSRSTRNHGGYVHAKFLIERRSPAPASSPGGGFVQSRAGAALLRELVRQIQWVELRHR